jgi:hydrogenase assembly chaperone HypC/HupF
MCNSRPCQVVEVGADGTAVVSDGDRRRLVSLLASEEVVAPGDWVLVLSGLVVRKLNESEAAAANAAWAEIGGTS